MFCFTQTDTFNLLVPHSGCKGSFDLYKEYQSVRGPGLAIPKHELLQIKVPAGTQPCDIMGVHPKMPFLKKLYDDGDAAFVANMGGLVEVCAVTVELVAIRRKTKWVVSLLSSNCSPLQPVTRDEFLKKKKRLPPGLFGVRWRW